MICVCCAAELTSSALRSDWPTPSIAWPLKMFAVENVPSDCAVSASNTSTVVFTPTSATSAPFIRARPTSPRGDPGTLSGVVASGAPVIVSNRTSALATES
jgi:hypothetical protein